MSAARPRPHNVVDALERLPLPVYTLGLDGTVTWLNPAGEALVGDAVGQHMTSVLSPESRRVAQDAVARKVVGHEPATEYEAVLLQRDGTRLLVEISSVPLESDGRIVGIFGIAVPEHELPPVKTTELTPRQAEILRLLAAGRSTHQMAAQLGLSIDTIRNHVRDLLKRLGVHSRLEAVTSARERGLI
jgi:PAS domain S-box-containing protein